jgi:hypothetical protein
MKIPIRKTIVPALSTWNEIGLKIFEPKCQNLHVADGKFTRDKDVYKII